MINLRLGSISVHQSDMRINLKLRVHRVMTYQDKFIQGYNLYCAFCASCRNLVMT